MKTATITEFRRAIAKILHWVENGESVEVTKRGKVIAIIRPPPPDKTGQPRWPDIAARTKAYCGNFKLSDKALKRILDESRGDAA